MTEEILDQMRRAPGLYLFGSANLPGVTFPVVVIKEHVDGPGRIFALEPKYEVEASAKGFGTESFLASGPHSIQQADADAEKEFERYELEAEADYFKDIALRAERHLRFARSLQDPKSTGFIDISDLIERIENFRRAKVIAEEAQPATA